MATIVLQTAGAAIGGLFGPVGAVIGQAAGALAGYAADRALLASTQRVEGPRLSTLPPFSAEEGAPIPRVYGTARVSGVMIWATRLKEVKKSEREGGKGGPKVTSYSYYGNFAFGLCEGEIAGIRRVWADGRELDLDRVEMRVHRGGETEEPDPLIEVKQGPDSASAYRGTAYVVFERLPLEDYGNRIPQMQFEVMRPVGRLNRGIRAVTLIPGATEYGLAPGRVRRKLREGESETVNRHVLHAATDLVASLDELQALCPNLETVALAVAWFGDDLRCGTCTIRPMVTAAGGGFSMPWKVSGLTRSEARVVSTHDGGPAYGGTPADRSVIEAIVEIKARGLKVTLYPFVMMDIAAGNVLPDPGGSGTQPAYPWRGRITATAGADKTAAAAAQLAAFVGDAEPADFTAGADTIGFSGDPDDWGYRRFVLHHARLAARAGGVDAFLLGSELRGLTTLRDGTGAFPFVAALRDLAADVRAMLGPSTKLTYGADWSEYFGHQPGDGSGDVFFHLDPLWAHPAIDAVGIDNYLPLADWRDEDCAGGNPDGFAGPYDPSGLRRSFGAGEGFDWYYASPADRAARARTPITDGAYGKAWVFRPKDLVSWWSEPHYDRPGGVESASPTAWTPRSKPIWFTELGCPAADKGPNQPNVFPDPKSAESAAPYFSSGGRSDLAQRRFVEAHQAQWDPASAGFDPAGNPVSPLYGDRMVAPDRITLWAWDARPFPAFPADAASWRDGGNWALGHWLNGRLSAAAVSDVIAAILAEHGFPDADVSAADGTLTGYVLSEPGSARSAIEPLLDLFGLAAVEEAGRLRIASTPDLGRAPVALDEIVLRDGGAAERTRTADADVPGEFVLAFRDPSEDYQAATVRAEAPDGAVRPQASLSVPAILEKSHAEALAADWLRRARESRETIGIAVAAAERRIDPGSLITVAGMGEAVFRVDAVEEGLVRTVAATKVGFWTPSRQAASVAPRPGVAGDLASPRLLLLDLPLPPGGGEPQDQLRAALWSRPWKSQVLFVSPGESGFAERAAFDRPATLGHLVAPLGPGFEGRWDHAASIDVELASGELTSVEEALLFNGSNAAAVRALDGGWEVLQFGQAEEIAPSLWRLTELLRGQLGTTASMASGAASGADFVLLDEAIGSAGLASSEIGLTLNWRAGPSGYDFSDAFFTTVAASGGVVALRPYAPVHLRGAVAGDGSLDLRWVRRCRIDADRWDAVEIPLGEDEERYRIEIRDGGGVLVRAAESTAPAWTYPAAEILADFGGAPASIGVSVRQVSRAVGPGSAVAASFSYP